MKEHIHFVFSDVFQIKSGGPVPPFPFTGTIELVLRRSGDDLLQSRVGLAVLDALNPELIDRLHDFNIHGVVAGNPAGAAHLAVIDDFLEFIAIVQSFFNVH